MALWQCGFEAVSSTPTISSTVALSMPRNTCGRSSCLRASPSFFSLLSSFLFFLLFLSRASPQEQHSKKSSTGALCMTRKTFGRKSGSLSPVSRLCASPFVFSLVELPFFLFVISFLRLFLSVGASSFITAFRPLHGA